MNKRFHVVSLPHTQTTDQFSSCAFTNKVNLFCRMMMDLGHDVFLYSGEQNETPCTERIACLSEDERQAAIGDKHYVQASFDWTLPHWRLFNGRAIDGIRKRAEPRDFICVIGGLAHKQIADAFPEMMTVEFGIGYGGTFAKYRVFESYAWMHTVYGAATGGNPNAADGNYFDAVIPAYLDMDRFPDRTKSINESDYYLFIGRLIERKGVQIAVDTCKALGKRLVVAGQGTRPAYGQYVGVVGPEERGKLMAGAKAVFVPTTYVEPFGAVVIEAMACGTPVISTDWGAMTGTVIDGVTGFRCHTLQDFIDAAEKVDQLDPRVIRRHVAQNYSLPVIAQKYDRYFNRLSSLWDQGWYQRREAA